MPGRAYRHAHVQPHSDCQPHSHVHAFAQRKPHGHTHHGYKAIGGSLFF